MHPEGNGARGVDLDPGLQGGGRGRGLLDRRCGGVEDLVRGFDRLGAACTPSMRRRSARGSARSTIVATTPCSWSRCPCAAAADRPVLATTPIEEAVPALLLFGCDQFLGDLVPLVARRCEQVVGDLVLLVAWSSSSGAPRVSPRRPRGRAGCRARPSARTRSRGSGTERERGLRAWQPSRRRASHGCAVDQVEVDVARCPRPERTASTAVPRCRDRRVRPEARRGRAGTHRLHADRTQVVDARVAL